MSHESASDFTPRVADALSRRLTDVTPRGVRVRVDVTEQDVAWNVKSLLAGSGGRIPRIEPREQCLLEILEDVQHFVGEKTRRAWPSSAAFAKPKDPPASREEALAYVRKRDEAFPRPGVRVSGGLLRLWYGDNDNPILELDPIPLTDA